MPDGSHRRTPMCDHEIGEKVQRSQRALMAGGIAPAFPAQAYGQHAEHLRAVLLRILECPACTDRLLDHTFRGTPAREGVQPTFAALVRTALVFAYGATEGETRTRIETRIRAWYLDERSGSTPNDPAHEVR